VRSRFWWGNLNERGHLKESGVSGSVMLILIVILIYLLTAIGLTPGGSSTVHIYIQTIHRTTKLTTLVGRLSGIRTQSGPTKINGELTE
jgi:uncharacterized integral membrane protein